jgi:hypothetical protein|tara:strand:- start:116 stop:2404 length:2289 start_codon:yes stop_codon:yes gene_type:complete
MALTPEQQQQLNDLLSEAGDLTADQVNSLKELLGLQNQSAESLRQQTEQLQANLKLLQQNIDADSTSFANKVRIQRLLEEEAGERATILGLITDELALEGQLSDETKKLVDNAKARGGAQKEFFENLENEVELNQQNLEIISRIKNAEIRRSDMTQDIIKENKKLGPINSKAVEISDKLLILAGARGKEIQKMYATNLLNQTVDNALIKSFGIMKKTLFEVDEQLSSFNKNFQFGPEYTKGIRDTYTELNEFGVSITEAAEAQTKLVKNVTDFTMMSADQQKALRDSAALAANLGVSLDSYTQGIQTSIAFFGQTGPRAIEIQGELAATARSLGLEQEQVASAFASSGGKLAKFGTDAVDTFKDLQRASKITGLEMDKLLAVTNRFDTFEGAADQAGKLNAALGGNFVNAMDLMMATDPVERFNMIRDSILDTGLSFNDMSYYQKNFYKDALGLADVGELALFLRGDMESLTGSVNESAESLIAQKERAQSVASIMEKFQAIIADNVEGIVALAEGLNKAVTFFMKFSDIFGMIIPAFVVFRAVTMAQAVATQSLMLVENARKAALVKGNVIKKISTLLTGKDTIAKGTNTAATGANVAAIEAQTVAMGSLSAAAGPAAVAMSGVALSIIGIGVAIGIAIASIAYLVNSFAKLFTSVAALAETDGLATVATEVAKIAAAIDQIPVIKAIAFKSVLDSAAVATNVTAPTAVATAANSVNAAGGAMSGTTTVKQPIKLFFGERELAEFVTEVVGDQVRIVQSSV